MKELLVIVLISSAIISGVVFTADSVDRRHCERTGRLMQMETKHLSFDQCYINTAKGWIPLDNYEELR